MPLQKSCKGVAARSEYETARVTAQAREMKIEEEQEKARAEKSKSKQGGTHAANIHQLSG
jgi:hypothetical protein